MTEFLNSVDRSSFAVLQWWNPAVTGINEPLPPSAPEKPLRKIEPPFDTFDQEINDRGKSNALEDATFKFAKRNFTYRVLRGKQKGTTRMAPRRGERGEGEFGGVRSIISAPVFAENSLEFD